ncbi:MAG: DNA primase, partial [Muribaculaceae bacterium]|nr:DNA primase [Muribaculaceae bacterium]
MGRIDQETVRQILDAANIVDVVSDFVSLKRRGANYIGLCPFHNERTPSFSVSPARGICKCFSCGKGGSPVNFIMEHEQMNFQEALRYLARKYNIEIREHELTDEERAAESERESLFAVNEFALEHFRHNLTDTEDGRDIGLAYFRERGINDEMIRRFYLGYALDRSNALYNAAKAKGFEDKFLVKSGLCIQSEERHTIYDRFKGRVIYPVHSISGKVVAFGGRTLRSDKQVAKYVNSPESEIYHKSSQLYGMFQAKRSIVEKGKCILVEGYMDVISMHQVGITNVVASSGTSLTEGQIRLIHRFTENVTVIYDSDPAGIKASLRGIDMLLAEGLNIKVLLLPDGEDPDSFAQKHTTREVEEYIAANETDFIRFKTRILLKDAADDPIRRASVINDVLRSIAAIDDLVKTQVYLAECARNFGVAEESLGLQLARIKSGKAEEDEKRARMRQAVQPAETPRHASADGVEDEAKVVAFLSNFEKRLLRYVVKYAVCDFCDVENEDG